MRHLRPLPPVDDSKQDWALVSETAIFAADPTGLDEIKAYLTSYYHVPDHRDAPVEIILCTGALRPSGDYITVRRAERDIDLLDEWAPIGSEVPDPSLSEMENNYKRLKQRKEEGEFEGAEEEARWYLQKMKDDIYRVEASIAEVVEAQKDLWGRDHPTKRPDGVSAS